MPDDAGRFDATFRATLTELFRWRRDVRHFRSDAVPDALLDDLLEVAALAPSVGLSQPWRFVTVDDPARRAQVRAVFEACNRAALDMQAPERAERYARLKLAGLVEAPRHLAIFVEPDPIEGHGLGRRTMPETVAFSAAMAVHTLWLAARAAGLGLGWVSILDPDRIAEILTVPSEWRLIGYLCLGYPVAEHDRPELEREGWEARRTLAPLRR